MKHHLLKFLTLLLALAATTTGLAYGQQQQPPPPDSVEIPIKSFRDFGLEQYRSQIRVNHFDKLMDSIATAHNIERDRSIGGYIFWDSTINAIAKSVIYNHPVVLDSLKDYVVAEISMDCGSKPIFSTIRKVYLIHSTQEYVIYQECINPGKSTDPILLVDHVTSFGDLLPKKPNNYTFKIINHHSFRDE
jgi:hypothetical protein